MKTTTNYLILNQACTDLVITIAEIMTVISLQIYGQDMAWGTLWSDYLQDV